MGWETFRGGNDCLFGESLPPRPHRSAVARRHHTHRRSMSAGRMGCAVLEPDIETEDGCANRGQRLVDPMRMMTRSSLVLSLAFLLGCGTGPPGTLTVEDLPKFSPSSSILVRGTVAMEPFSDTPIISRSPAALKRQICDVRPAGCYPLMRGFENRTLGAGASLWRRALGASETPH